MRLFAPCGGSPQPPLYIGISLFLTICSRLLLSFENLCDHLVWSISFTFAHNSTCIYFEFLLTITVQCAMCMQMQINFYVCISSYRSLSLSFSVYTVHKIHLFCCCKQRWKAGIIRHQAFGMRHWCLTLFFAIFRHLILLLIIITICSTFLLCACFVYKCS